MAYYWLFYTLGLKRLCRRVTNLRQDKYLRHKRRVGYETRKLSISINQ